MTQTLNVSKSCKCCTYYSHFLWAEKQPSCDTDSFANYIGLMLALGIFYVAITFGRYKWVLIVYMLKNVATLVFTLWGIIACSIRQNAMGDLVSKVCNFSNSSNFAFFISLKVVESTMLMSKA